MENTTATPKVICDKCHKFAVVAGGEFFYIRSAEYFYCKECNEAHKAK